MSSPPSQAGKEDRPHRPPTSSVSTTDEQHTTSEEGQAILPVNTKVQVIGNNRTKQSLIGQRGFVMQAGDLGGWHTLELESGLQVRLQRNALAVLEQPPGAVEQSVLLHGEDERGAKVFSPIKRSVRQAPMTPPQGTLKPPPSRRISLREASRLPMCNFNKLDSNVLRRYRKHYGLAEVGPNPTRTELLQAIERHFVKQVKVDERQLLHNLMQAAAARRHDVRL